MPSASNSITVPAQGEPSGLLTDQLRWSWGDAMMKEKIIVGRRDFLHKVGIGTVGTGTMLATPLVTSAQADSESDSDKRKARYKETDHVKAYYRVNSYPR
jgi:hypothetical protein